VTDLYELKRASALEVVKVSVAYLSLFTYHGYERVCSCLLNFLELDHIDYFAMKPTIARHSDMPGRKLSKLSAAIGTMLTWNP
jgi:hypothetical protein